MRKFLLAGILFLALNTGKAQIYADGVNLNEKEDLTYIELVGINTAIWGMKLKIFVDYGQKLKVLKPTKITDEKGKTMKFNTMVHVLNYFYQNGWELEAFSRATVNGKVTTSYILRRKK